MSRVMCFSYFLYTLERKRAVDRARSTAFAAGPWRLFAQSVFVSPGTRNHRSAAVLPALGWLWPAQ